MTAEVEDSPSLSFLKTINLEGCLKLQNMPGIEKLKRLEYLHLPAANPNVWSCIERLQRLPSKFASLIGRAVVEAESILNPNLFSEVIGAYGAVSEISAEIPVWLSGMISWLIKCNHCMLCGFG